MDARFSESEKTQRYYSLTGNYALTWGSFEATVRRAIPRLEAPSSEIAFFNKLSKRLPELNRKQFGQLISELKTVVQKGFGETPSDWESCIV